MKNYEFRKNFEILDYNPSCKAVELQLPLAIPLNTDLYLNFDTNILNSRFVSFTVSDVTLNSNLYATDYAQFYLVLRNDNNDIVAQVPIKSLTSNVNEGKYYNKIYYSNVNMKKSSVICVGSSALNNGKILRLLACYKN